MKDLVNKSLARRTVTSDDITGTWYSVHNLQLTFLQEQSTDLQLLHKELVDRYRKVHSDKSRKSDPYGLTLVSVKVYKMSGQRWAIGLTNLQPLHKKTSGIRRICSSMGNRASGPSNPAPEASQVQTVQTLVADEFHREYSVFRI